MPILAVLALAFAAATDPPPRIERPTPWVVQRGTTATLELRGRDLHPECRAVLTDTTGAVIDTIQTSVTSRAKGRVALRVTVPAGSQPGPRELRLVSPVGVSNAVALHVGTRPVVQDREPNDAPESAQALPVPSLVCGTIHAATQVDRLRVQASAGSDLVFELRTRELTSPLDATMTMVDSRGRTVAWSQLGEDGVSRLVFRAKTDARLDLLVRDLQYRGGADYIYHLVADRRTAPAAAVEFPRVGTLLESAVTGILRAPFAVSGQIDRPGEIDSYRFALTEKTTLELNATTEGLASPLDPLLELTDADGKRLRADDDSGTGNAARIQHTLQPGRYVAQVRSLLGTGSARHRYVLRVAPHTASRADFAVRLRPDAVRVSRGSHAKSWCEVTRRGGFKAPVTIEFTDLPRGVSIDPVPLNESNGWTSVFTVTATMDADLGPHPVRLIARARLGDAVVVRTAQAEDGVRLPHCTWLTVLPPAPFVVTPVGPTPEPVRRRWQEERRELTRILATDTAAVRRELDEFRRAHAEGRHWITLAPGALRAASGSELEALDDGSVLVRRAQDRDVFTVELQTGSVPVVAIRLDAMTHRSLPAGGPGWAKDNGNFVLSRLLVQARAGDAARSTQVALREPRSRFAQQDFPAQNALDDIQMTGWANHPQSGRANWWIADLETPIAAGSRLTITLDQQYGRQHLLGRIRIAVATRRLPPKAAVVPPAIAADLARRGPPTPALGAWFRDIAPSLAGVRARIAEIDAGRGHATEIARLEAELHSDTPARAAARRDWEGTITAGLPRWTPLSLSALRSTHGVRFEKQADHVARVRRVIAPRDDYTLKATTAVRRITALRLEALPDQGLPGGGPGLSSSGNFVLTGVRAQAWPATDPSAVVTLQLHAAEASFAQPGHPVAGTLDGKPDTGWAVLGRQGRFSEAVWRLRSPLDLDGPVGLRITLAHQSEHPKHLLGRFRISVTDAEQPGLGAPGLAPELTRALQIPAARRSKAQLKMIIDHYRRVTPKLQALRERLDILRAQQVDYPPSVRRGEQRRLAVRLDRRDFTGPVKLTLEGFSSGRGRDRAPRRIGDNLAVDAVELGPTQAIAVFELRAKANCELGTRAVVVRAAGQVRGRPAVEYSRPILLTVRR